MDNLLPFLNIKSPLDPDLALLKQKLDLEYKKMGRGVKINTNYRANNDHYLPSLFFLFEFIGIKYDLVHLVDKLNELGAEPLKLSRTALYDLPNILNGDIQKIIDELMLAENTQKLKGLGDGI